MSNDRQPTDAAASLHELGWTAFFSQQVSAEAMAADRLARVVTVQRSQLEVCGNGWERRIAVTGPAFRVEPHERPTVGDWVLLEASGQRIERVLERKSVFKRVAAGNPVRLQLIAANIDTLFVVTSCNDEFKESRLERYLALASEAGVSPVIVLTKIDLTDDAQAYVERALSVQRGVAVEPVNALDADAARVLTAWVPTGTTAALVGSSGVGKSTLINTLIGAPRVATREIREHDAKGRHTTTARSIHRLPAGGLLVDVPGMRELKVAELGAAIGEVFADIAALASRCRFVDCRHDVEPGCAVRAAAERGELDARRWENYQKLLREEIRNNRSLAEQRSYERTFSKVVKNMKALNKELGLKR